MGICNSKKEKKYMVNIKPFIAKPIETEKCSPEFKIKMAEAIKKNDIILISRLLTFVRPTENLQVLHDNFTCFHFAAKHNANRAMALFIALIQHENPGDKDNLARVINFADKNKRTPAMICALYNSPETLYMLLKTDLVDQRCLDKDRKDLWMLCDQFSKPCHLMLKLSQNRKDFKEPLKVYSKLIKELYGLSNRVDRKKTKTNEEEGNIPPISTTNKNIKQAAHEETNDQDFKEFHSKGLLDPVDFVEWFKVDHMGPIDDWWKFDEYGAKLKQHDNEHLCYVPTDTKLYDTITEVLLLKHECYEDIDFPHSDDAMGTLRYKNLVWQRPDVVFQVPFERLNIFEQIEIKNVKLGEKNTCFLLSALTSLAEYPERLVKIFLNKRVNALGCYGIKMYHKGKPFELIFDDFLPCKQVEQSFMSAFSNPGGIEIWIVLLEKAWAKFFGAFSACEFALSSEVWEYLLGIPTSVHSIDELTEEELWRKIMEADRSNFFVTAATRDDAKEKYGLISTHSYTMISAFEIGDHKIMKFRNNWDLFIKERDYSDSSQFWKDQAMMFECTWAKSTDHIFFISFKDFRLNFCELMVGHYYNNWHYTYVEAKGASNHAEYFNFTIKEPTHAYIRVHQRNERFLDSGYAPVEFNIYKIDQANYRLFQPITGTKGDVDPHCLVGNFSVFPNKRGLILLQQGDYVVRVKIGWKNKELHPFTLSAYSDVPFTMEHSERLKNVRARIAVHMGMFSEVKRLDQGQGCYIARMWTDNEHLIYAENSGEKKWTLEINFPKQINAKPFKPYRVAEDKIVMVLEPGMRNGTGNKILNRLKKVEIVPEFISKWEEMEKKPDTPMEPKGGVNKLDSLKKVFNFNALSH